MNKIISQLGHEYTYKTPTKNAISCLISRVEQKMKYLGSSKQWMASQTLSQILTHNSTSMDKIIKQPLSQGIFFKQLERSNNPIITEKLQIGYRPYELLTYEQSYIFLKTHGKGNPKQILGTFQ